LKALNIANLTPQRKFSALNGIPPLRSKTSLKQLLLALIKTKAPNSRALQTSILFIIANYENNDNVLECKNHLKWDLVMVNK
jgi:hypothetical protein